MKKSNQEENLWGLKGLKKVKTQLQSAHKNQQMWRNLLRATLAFSVGWTLLTLLPLWTQQIPPLSNLLLTPKGYKAAQQLVCSQRDKT